MTEDESGLPPLEPADLDIPHHDFEKRLLFWLVETVANMDLPREERDKLERIFQDEEFKHIADYLVDELRNQLAEDPTTLPKVDDTEILRKLDELAKRKKEGTSSDDP